MFVTYEPAAARWLSWSAVSLDYQAGDPIGWGSTREQAIHNLLMQINTDLKEISQWTQ